MDPSKMKVVELKDELENMGLSTDGLKADLAERLENALTPVAKSKTPAKPKTPVTKPKTPVTKSKTPVAKPKTPLAKEKTATRSAAKASKLLVSDALSSSLEPTDDAASPFPVFTAAKKKGGSKKKSSAGALYFSLLAKYPYGANAVQAALINAAGVIASAFVPAVLGSGPAQPVDWYNVLVFMCIGAFVVIPLILNVLVKRLLSNPKLSKLQVLAINTLFGTFVISAAFELSFPVFTDFLHPGSTGAACLKPAVAGLFTRRFLDGCLKSRLVFLPADVANTFMVTPALQPLVSNLAGFIWTIVLAVTMGGGDAA